MWELLHEKVPFDGDLGLAIQYVVEEDARPAIQTVNMDEYNESVRDLEQSTSKRGTVVLRDTGELDQENMLLTEDMANIIRRCWQSDMKARPNLA